ncbi:acyl-coenzyme A:6-aminopenicillanic acid acyl-transferase-domain-containing protein [Pseudomassariella vexata]|uniref:Acyl-coenzyme A:6-aminopenicillanic acid acyl-transferase-domain-containing protein n=1 Tax=Pseudomassariella vexata TaxID=1141098 RepID=A0A1Y2DEM7_9PEZI|nr:acyl-coenzyme A:6-aminopenicillanic acid acyl-transferase-domain-containing protein [Pseudomassariella vexata]ORY57730.1 acyl-coenzyme A:6-aminopenicillanic acid acyl-transferase-domain-containing protein [Pseudomassariella vexata]
MLEVRCSGSPYEIGHTQGTVAKSKVNGSIAFYRALFQKSCSLDWDGVLEEASYYVEPLGKTCPRYLEELRGLADGAGLAFLDILALNVRTEINFGMFSDKTKDVDEMQSDGCTSVGWLTPKGQSFLSQNWDWMVEQEANIIVCHISQPGTGIPDISIVTEAGIIGKIGLNSAGVGCCLNAIRARGVDRSKFPTHFALRTILESSSMESAIEKIKSLGVAGSAHILIADKTGSTGVECTSIGMKKLPMDNRGRICHTNHLILDHPGVEESAWLKDSLERLSRVQELTDLMSAETLDMVALSNIYEDEQGYPASINRRQVDDCESQTVFNIIMDLTNPKAWVTFGRPTQATDKVTFEF